MLLGQCAKRGRSVIATSLLIVYLIQASAGQVAECGAVYEGPFASGGDTAPRICETPQERQYTPRYRGLAYRLLDDESAVCFVPDAAYQLLDRLIDDAKKQPAATVQTRESVRQTLGMIGNLLVAHGFALHIPTHTVGDALVNRARSREPVRHIFDCDTGSVIVMTIAEHLGVQLSLVEITLTSGMGHNYVRWVDVNGRVLDWDVNGRCECATPSGVLPHEGKAMTPRQIEGYFRGLMALIHQRNGRNQEALAAYRDSATWYPESPWAWNNLAWLIATRELPERSKLAAEAVAAAATAVRISRTPDYLDTHACSLALNRDFVGATRFQREALEKAPGNEAFTRRLALFAQNKDCTGEP